MSMLEIHIEKRQSIENRIEEYKNKMDTFKTSIDKLQEDLKALEYKKTLCVNLADMDKLDEFKKLCNKIELIQSDIKAINEIMTSYDKNFKAEIKADLKVMMLEENAERHSIYSVLAEEKREKFLELIKAQWLLYADIEQLKSEFMQFDNSLLWLWEELELGENEEIENRYRYNNYQDGLNVLYHLKPLLYQGFLPSPQQKEMMEYDS